LITTVISDLGGVILKFDHRIACGKLARIARCSESKVYDFFFVSGVNDGYDSGKITSQQLYLRTKEYLNLNISMEEFAWIWSDIFAENEEVSSILRTLRRKYRLYLLSNTNEFHFEFIRSRFPIVGIFEGMVISYKVGFMKPAPAIYHEVLKLAGVSPDECVYIDDIPVYIDAACKIGINTIHYQSPGQLRIALRQYGVMF
jgi:putative hydrolase of the HAD superfamily